MENKPFWTPIREKTIRRLRREFKVVGNSLHSLGTDSLNGLYFHAKPTIRRLGSVKLSLRSVGAKEVGTELEDGRKATRVECVFLWDLLVLEEVGSNQLKLTVAILLHWTTAKRSA